MTAKRVGQQHKAVPTAKAQQPEATPAAPKPQAAWPGLGAKQPTAAATATPAAAPKPEPPKSWLKLGGSKEQQPASPTAASKQHPAAGWGSGRLNFLAALAPDQAEVAALALPGLRNESGEFNCFLNVVLQCLWRCEEFRFEVGGGQY